METKYIGCVENEGRYDVTHINFSYMSDTIIETHSSLKKAEESAKILNEQMECLVKLMATCGLGGVILLMDDATSLGYTLDTDTVMNISKSTLTDTESLTNFGRVSAALTPYTDNIHSLKDRARSKHHNLFISWDEPKLTCYVVSMDDNRGTASATYDFKYTDVPKEKLLTKTQSLLSMTNIIISDLPDR